MTAATRAKFDNKTGAPGTLVFCGAIPAIYQQASYPTPDKEEEEKEVSHDHLQVPN